MTVNDSIQTIAFDPVTIAGALSELEARAGGFPWSPNTEGADAEAQDMFTQWLYQNWKATRVAERALDGLRHKVCTDVSEINGFLSEHGFHKPVFIRPHFHLGVAAALNISAQWSVDSSITHVPDIFHRNEFQVYEILSKDVKFFKFPKPPRHGKPKYPDRSQPLVSLPTSDGGEVCLMMERRPRSSFELVETAIWCMAERIEDTAVDWPAVVVPAVKIDTLTPVTWLEGLTSGRETVTHVYQGFRFRLGPEGAVQSHALTPTYGPHTPALVFDRPFIGWYTKPNVIKDVPVGVFYAGYDAWRELKILPG